MVPAWVGEDRHLVWTGACVGCMPSAVCSTNEVVCCDLDYACVPILYTYVL